MYTYRGYQGDLTYIDNDARIKINEDGRKYSHSPLPWQKLFKMKNVKQMRFFKLYFILKKINNSETINYTFESKSAQEIVKLFAMYLCLRYNNLCLSNQQFY